MEIIARLANLPGALPGACAQGLIWGIMAIGVYLTYRILDVADLTVDGSFGTGGAVCVMCLLSGQNVWVSLLMALLAGLLSGFVTGVLHTFMGIPAILAGILTQLSLYSINLKIMGKANQAINVDKYNLLISLRWVKEFALHNPIVMIIIVTAVLIGILYWFFGTELGCAIRATGSNPAMSRAQGINTNFNIVLGLAVSNGLVALSGALLSQYQGFADVGMGRGAIVIGLAGTEFMWPKVSMNLFGVKFTWSLLGYNVLRDATGNILIGGGLGYFISYELGSFLAQCINFPLQRNITFKSHGNPVYQAIWYFVAWVVISLICNGFNNLWMPVASAYVAPAVYNMLVTIITGGVSMVIFFFVFKIIFPEGKAE